ncbi:coiled-coil domain-containing protein 180-like isoform X2 [Pomacea canaliculata]|uniref:coiled-coil domain-containing protein 180-like isoform X2 n=1 Tax=Pomacea canaliculata TaxID=400727 RepID=UPI000D72E73A|nr:coiled-coil domain-containing protein 180-like isoform X2 [Pomacea canaliculata]
MSETKSMRVVPSGKIYRQMFDAQLQLSKSLTKVVSQDRHLPEMMRISSHNLPASAPVFRLTREDTAHGILTRRQHTWVEAFPNDPYTENPILYKQYKEFVRRQFGISENFEAGIDVRSLPDIVVPAKQGSDIIERITASRKERHETAVEDMHQELSVISTETEPQITRVSEETLQMLAEGGATTAGLLALIEKDENLLTYSLDDLISLWKEVENSTPWHRELIQQLDMKLNEIEEKRMERIRRVFQEYSETLKKISYLLTPDLERLLDRESQVINQTCLSNRRAYADLFVRLMSADLERERTQHSTWCQRVEDWQMLRTNKAVQSFRDFMQSEDIVKPPGVENVRKFMITELEILNSQRLEFISSLRDLKPPVSTKSAVYTWRQQMKKVSQELESVSQMHLTKLYEEMEKVCQSCLEKIENIKRSMLEEGIVTESKAQQVVEEQMLPLVGEQQRMFEQNLDTMEKSIAEHTKKMEDAVHSMFKYAQGVAHLWDVHEIGLAKQERALQEKLDDSRHEHDYVNQEWEANLDIVMDRMRQDASEEALRDSLSKVFDMLEKIQEFYKEFHQSQKNIVHMYPDMVQSELNNFDQAICTYFSLDRTHPDDKAKAEEELRPQTPTEPVETEVSRKFGSVTPEQTRRISRSIGKTKAVEEAPPKVTKPIAMAVAEVLSTSKGTTFYVLTVAGEHGIPEEDPQEQAAEHKEQLDSDVTESDGTFLTEMPVGSEVKDTMPEYLKAIDMSPSFLVDVKKSIRMNFLNFLETWCGEAKERALSVVVAKCEELNSELDLRLHLHQPRSRRAEYDVHNVRAAELVMHAERVTRHCKGVDQSLSELRARFVAMSLEHNKLATKFRHDIEALEVIFINATKSSRLVALQNQLAVELDKFMAVIRTSLRQFRQHLDETLQMLRDSNARFIKSFKLFSEGGNFCPEEVEEYRKRLEKMSHRVDGAEGSIMSELEGMESKRLEVASKVASEFEDRFKSHMFDLLFMEQIARWLTNTQVKIKCEVAASNAQAQNLDRHLDDLEHRIDAYEQPRFDKEQTSPSQLNDFLKSVMELFQKRCGYLNCKLEAGRPQSCVPQIETQETPASPSASKVGFSSEGLTSGSKPGKPSSEDPSISVIKSILKTQKYKLIVGADAEAEELASTGMAATPTSGIPMDATREKNKSAHSQASTRVNEGEKPTASRRPTLPSLSSEPGRNLGLKRGSKTGKLDKSRSFLSGEDGVEENHFLGLIMSILREAMSGLTTTAELYYKQKGVRPVTRPQVLQETFEQCSEVITQKLQSYYQQADDYHNQCLQEFRQQLSKMEHLTARVPPIIIKDMLKQHVARTMSEQDALHAKFKMFLEESNTKKIKHENNLRPQMGHPHQAPELEVLCELETQRHEEHMLAIAEHIKSLKTSTESNAKMLLEGLVQLSEQQLLQYDDLLVVDEVDKGRVERKRHPTIELIRRKMTGEALEEDQEENPLPRGKGNWLGFPSNQLVLENRPNKIQLTPAINTAKITLGHSSTIKARDMAYEDYKVLFEKTLASIEEEEKKFLQDEERWAVSWTASIQHIKDLYKTP